jgi:protein-disulfide isomerase
VIRRHFLAAAGIGALALATGLLSVRMAGAQDTPRFDPALTDSDRILGSADAPVTMLEFASFTCPHCASFHAEVLPALKGKYIDTGKVRLVFRDFPLDGMALRAAVLARCAPEAQYYNLVSALFQTQRNWAFASDPNAALAQMGGMAGMSKDSVDACLADTAAGEAIVAGMQQAGRTYLIDSTPTFIIDGETVKGARSVAEFEAVIDAKLAAAGAPPS